MSLSAKVGKQGIDHQVSVFRGRQDIGVTSEGEKESKQERDREIRKFSFVYLPGRNRLAPKMHSEPTKHYVGRISLPFPPHRVGVGIFSALIQN